MTADQTPMRRNSGQATAAAGFWPLPLFPGLAFQVMSSCDSRLSSKAWVASLWVASLQALRSAARCSQPLTGMSQARREFLKESL